MTTAAQVTVYTDTNMPPVPEIVGNWVRIERVDVEYSRTTWRLTYENSVGGSVGYRFATLRAARAYEQKLAIKRAA